MRLPLWDLLKASSVKDWSVNWISRYDKQTAVQCHTRLRKLDLHLILKTFVLYLHFIYFYVQYWNCISQRNYTKLRSRALLDMWHGKALRMCYQIRVVTGAHLKYKWKSLTTTTTTTSSSNSQQGFVSRKNYQLCHFPAVLMSQTLRCNLDAAIK